MVYNQRLNPDRGAAEIIKNLRDRVAVQETKPTGVIYVQQQITTTDPVTGVQTQFGQLPDGTYGFLPFINDVTPPPVPSMPTVVSQVGTVILTWDGTFSGGALPPRDYDHCNVYGQKSGGATKLLGSVKNPQDSVIAGADVVTPGESWTFWATSVDFNGNESAASTFVGPITIASVADDGSIANIQQTANSKNTITYSASAASGSGIKAGDTWFQRDSNNTIIGQWEWTGSLWNQKTLNDMIIANLDAGKITAGTINALRIGAGTIGASAIAAGAIDGKLITGATVRTALPGSSSGRVEMGSDANGSYLKAWSASSTATPYFSATKDGLSLTGNLQQTGGFNLYNQPMMVGILNNVPTSFGGMPTTVGIEFQRQDSPYTIPAAIYSAQGYSLNLTSQGGNAYISLADEAGSSATMSGSDVKLIGTASGNVSITKDGSTLGNLNVATVNGVPTSVQHWEGTVSSSPPTGAVWGPGMWANDSTSTTNTSLVSIPSNDRIVFPNAGIYAVSIKIDTGVVNGSYQYYVQMSDDTNSNIYHRTEGAPNGQFLNFEWANLRAPAANTMFRIVYYQNSGSTKTWVARIRITRLN